MLNKKKRHGKSKAIKTPATNTTLPVAGSRPDFAEAEPPADTRIEGSAAESVRPTTLSMNPAWPAASEVASAALLSSIRSNFDALRVRLKKARGEPQQDRTTSGKTDKDLATALDRLEAGYRELLRGI